MQLPGLIAISPDDTATLKRLADMMGESFMEEMWFETWLEGLDALGTSEARKLEIMQAYFLDDLSEMAQRQGVYALEDLTAATGGYLASEYRAVSVDADDESHCGQVERMLTPEEFQALDAQEKKMHAISDFDWHLSWPRETDDYIYFASWAVDKNARGTHALSRLLAPILAFADENGLDCYLECYAGRLQRLYEHYGFRVVRELHDEQFPVYERCMIRPAQV